ncbi:MAG: double-strand break repair helicase AddA [Paracoccaceae bacterium]|nr:double-strand break repair helicase AddA [Paracoccaceae bacterium]
MIRDAATQRQVQAAHPNMSTWLSANAGSGKTKVLTDRVARLLLSGISPEHILCLTYTKAAASEMQNRLFKRLGKWAMLGNDALGQELIKLGLDQAPDTATLRRARTLFARAIEAPGGLKIQTIHSFCATILRRFPLEAGVSPQFKEMEERASVLLCGEVLEAMAQSTDAPLVDALALFATEHSLEKLVQSVIKYRHKLQLASPRSEIWARFGLAPGSCEATVLSEVLSKEHLDLITRIIPLLDGGGKTDVKMATQLRRITHASFSALAILEGVFLFGGFAKNPFGAKIGKFPSKDLRLGVMAEDMPELEQLMLQVEGLRETRLTLQAAQKTAVLHEFAARFLPLYERQKQLRGWLDFDDLILRARNLLSDPKVADWVLYRLDGGIDHILVDEAQDTSPVQWDVIQSLAQEFTSGQGARAGVRRTIFVVGDKKQSIYSFQGADPTEFDRMKQEFAERLKESETPLLDTTLEYSFRSSSAILSVVDQTFQEHVSSGFESDQMHRAFKTDMPGRVDLWPVIDPVERQKDTEWQRPVDLLGQDNHLVQLADEVARSIDQMISERTPLPQGNDAKDTYSARPVEPGDFLILVQRRSDLFHEIIRACKARNLPIAGADRLKVGAELAVRDLAALLSFLATPEDDLSLAIVLKSPLFNWNEQRLFSLAHGRGKQFLWQKLRNATKEYQTELTVLDDLLQRADFLRPYDLLERILSRHEGRLKILSRLGPEAEDGLNALLSQALSYEQNDVPSLTGFLVWMETDTLEIKRQMDSAGNQIRVMTVHGAKGLESPIVILPDCAHRQMRLQDELIDGSGGVIWKTKSDEMPDAIRRAAVEKQQSEIYERDRLLYVAMTRAEKWLMVAAAGDITGEPTAWYSKVQSAMQQTGAVKHSFGLGDGLRVEHGAWPSKATGVPAKDRTATIPLPDWVNRLPTESWVKNVPLSPSDLGGAKALPAEDGLDENMAKMRGSQIHKLLEVLPDIDPSRWPQHGAAILANAGIPAEPFELSGLMREATDVIQNPDLGFLFSPEALSEVGISGQLSPQHTEQMNGVIDRLLVRDDDVWVVDFKTNAKVPKTPSEVPVGLLRQLGAYATAIARLYPNQNVKPAILWTKTAQLMPISYTAVAAEISQVELS